MLVKLSWPPKLLWPNGSRGNHFSVSAAKKKYRHEAEWATIAARGTTKPDFGEAEIPVKLIVYPKPRGPLPDKDNCVSAMKVGLDAIAAQIGINDRQFAAPVVEFSPLRYGRIEVVL